MSIDPTWQLALALVLLVGLTALVSRWGHLGIGKDSAWAAVRAIIQLGVVSVVLVYALRHLWAAALFTLLMFVVAVRTTAKRTGVQKAWPWTAAAMACGILPVLLIVFGTGTAPFTAASLIPLAGIIIGNMMNGHTLAGRRLFPELRANIGTYEAALSLGLMRPDAISMVTEASVAEAIVPTVDNTRTVGLVTLPGAFVGVLLGGGSALQAGASQVLVLLGILAGQAVTIVVAHHFVKQGLLLPPDLKEKLHP
ncbi:ABC transporter permease [Acidipropionibacterium timonense]|uniref:ABC transporter permease n=1 Tax=Acidipropionibacterium timonense TaxID=2161818 RepID=UPI00102FD909|nr:ABC transporter permease [Acidipropionibacterium timonense]